MSLPAFTESELLSALYAVTERSFFAFAEPMPDDADARAASGWYEATVAFNGPFPGRVVVSLPVDLAHELCAAFVGASELESIDEFAAKDLSGELANQITGAWLTRSAGSECFNLQRPDVCHVQCPTSRQLAVLVNDQPLFAAVLPS